MSAEQIRTHPCSTAHVMRHPNFVRGLEEKRAGVAFAYDLQTGAWFYERGRQFGAIAPPSMPLFINGKLNPKAVRLFDTAYDRRLIR